MIYPNEIEPIAKLAYGIFREKHPSNPVWDEIGLAGKTTWRDRVIAADRMRRHVALENQQDDCALVAIRQWEKPKDKVAVAPVDDMYTYILQASSEDESSSVKSSPGKTEHKSKKGK